VDLGVLIFITEILVLQMVGLVDVKVLAEMVQLVEVLETLVDVDVDIMEMVDQVDLELVEL
jgi:hypothetical protein